MDQTELELLAKSHTIVKKRITDIAVSIKYHNTILENKIIRLKKEEDYYKTLKDRYTSWENCYTKTADTTILNAASNWTLYFTKHSWDTTLIVQAIYN